MAHLILGGARSGKSGYAERIAASESLPVTVVVTAESFDEGMQARIERHRQDRPSSWVTREAPLYLAECVLALPPGQCVIVDCLTVWLNNHLYHFPDEPLMPKITKICEAVKACPATLILVSNEVGMGVVPLGEITRQFVDHAGWMNQALALVCEQVTLISAGLPLALKGGKHI
ncbi:MAG: bifunctional adenosylcobinamide kinase/adenosylcobinamide-phosphate guanylyltransferase [Hahellaceae bacterium]|nr:bifunctional adenosylcobinamide kinase/adenosylcobinamide-phosphate guanylyltransferase [Hahellaceae bacterium]